MAEEGASFLAVVPARERELPETSQPAKPEADVPERTHAEAVVTALPEAEALVQPEEVDSKAGNKARPPRTKGRKASASSGTEAGAQSKTAGKRKRGGAAKAKTGGPKSTGSRRKDQ